MLTAAPPAEIGPAAAPSRRAVLAARLPGLGLVAAAVAVAIVAAGWLDPLSPLVIAVALGVLVANTWGVSAAAAPGVAFSGRTLLRGGVALLGFQLSIRDVFSLGFPELFMVMATVAVTFQATRWLGRRIGLGDDVSLLVATGYSICGASAIAAMDDVVKADEEDVAVSIALVTLCGTLAIVVLPLLRLPLGLDPELFGKWVGASVHDVGQVVAASSSAGDGSLQAAVLVKLTRVLMLAPLVVLVASSLRRRAARSVSAAGHAAAAPTGRPPLVPTFLVGFVAAVALRSLGVVPEAALARIAAVKEILLAAGLFALGTGVRIARLRRVGARPFLLGLGSWVVIAGVSYVGVLLVG